jgi:putative chitinase
MNTEAVLLECGVSRSRAAVFSGLIAEVMARYYIDTVTRKKHFLAQILHESGHLRWREELASGSAYEGRRDLGNTRPGDGRRFKGRGLIQLTGRANYMRYSASRIPIARGFDVKRFPSLVATDDELCCDVSGWYWLNNGLNGLADSPQLSEDDTCRAITKRINGGYNGLAERLELTKRARVALMRKK